LDGFHGGSRGRFIPTRPLAAYVVLGRNFKPG